MDELFEVLAYWYKDARLAARLLSAGSIPDMDSSASAYLWTNVWFAKGDRQEVVDGEIRARFELHYHKFADYAPASLLELVALVVLYDQMPRNMFRGSAQAYGTDDKALAHATAALDACDGVDLPLHVAVFLCLPFIHSERADVFARSSVLLADLRLRYDGYPVVDALTGVWRNHNDRMSLFGRIPERNRYLGRTNTEAEARFLAAVDG